MSIYSFNNIIEKVRENPKMIWTFNDVAELLRNYSDYSLRGYALKHEKLFLELTYLLNEGYIKYTISNYQFPFFQEEDYLKEFQEFKARLNNEEKDIFQQIERCSYTCQEMYMRYIAWKKLYEQGVRDVDIKKRTYALYAKDQQIMVQTGNVGIKHLMNSFKKGLNQFIIMPYATGTEGDMVILSKTEKFEHYIAEEIKTLSKEKKFFRKYKKSNKLLPKYDGIERFNEYDLIEFYNGDKEERGIVIKTIPASTGGIEKAKEALLAEQIIFSSTKSKVKFKQMFKDEGYPESRILIKVPRKKSDVTLFEYHAIRKEEVKSKIPLDFEGIEKTVEKVLKRSNNGNLTLQYRESDGYDSNAAYEPKTNRILVSVENTLNLCIKRFLDEKLCPNDTTEMLIAHELGHADQRAAYLFNDNYYTTIDRINEIELAINNKWKAILNNTADIEDLEFVINSLEEQCILLGRFNEIELKSEMDAFQFGVEYLPDELKWAFQIDSVSVYEGYKNRNQKRIFGCHNKRYMILDMLPTYEKMELQDFDYLIETLFETR